MRFGGTSALITGGASGIGRAIAERLHSEGARVVIVDRDAEQLESTIDRLGGRAHCVVADVLDPTAVDRAVGEALTVLAGCDVLVNNAAYLDAFGSATDTTAHEWNRAIEGTLTSAYRFTVGVLPHMVARGSGSIVNVASVLGIVGKESMCAYMTAKAGLIQFTRSIAIDYGRAGIRANAICPAAIDTENNRRFTVDPEALREVESATVLGRLGEPHEVAAAAAFLASAEAAFVTATTLCVDGGWTAR